AGRDVRGHDDRFVVELHLLVPVAARPFLDRLADLARGAQYVLVGCHLVGDVDGCATTKTEIALPIESMVDEELHVSMKEVPGHDSRLLARAHHRNTVASLLNPRGARSTARARRDTGRAPAWPRGAGGRRRAAWRGRPGGPCAASGPGCRASRDHAR